MMQDQPSPDAMTIEAWTFTGAAFVVLALALAALIFVTRRRK